ncbi:maleylacetate reductase [Bordetella sp. 02P26C-1]|uniref:maleylacetate reductase n=1 Tax=Bordetella sp. 02P26C-1 TaxID=2683195 RepID=UPI001353BE09|nr:maleylacetate reductase [Bordetella sp. 02P26C-1]MVW79047.1 iron-containing alcohol dehydrogenase [Bordetella sp. 02P26C-1]
MHEFVYTAQSARVVFGTGALRHLEAEVEQLSGSRVLVLSTPNQRPIAELALQLLGARGVGVYDQAKMHVPVATVRDAAEVARRLSADCTVAIGGGSTTGLAKGLALECGLPIVAVPTTYAGSEMTPIYGMTEGGIKTTGKDVRVLPRSVIYDPDLSAGLPTALAAASGLNAMAHAAEGLYARDGNPIMGLLAEESIRALARGLRRVVAQPLDSLARSDCLYGAWLAGTVLGNVGMALHHKLCHTLGGTFNLPHAQTHAIILPYAMAYNSAAAPQAMDRIARALGDSQTPAATSLYKLVGDLGVPCALRDIGLQSHQVDQAVDLVMAQPYWNPRPMQRDALSALLQAAYEGTPPDLSV